jgi:peptidoglycan hydrolase-like protein with peptidoglycan-binding domain
MPADLKNLHPTVKAKAEQLVENCKKRGVEILITQGYRSIAYQNDLYAQGRTKPGKIVTKARGGQSPHNYGLAIDFALKSGKQVLWDIKKDLDGDGKSDWMEVVEEAKKLGFEWGGDWKSFVDYPHFQMMFGLSIRDLQNGKRPPNSAQPEKVTYPVHTDSSLGEGDTGAKVVALQKDLLKLGFKLPQFGADGDLGNETVLAVKAFQKSKGLVQDGVVGKNTRAALDKALADLNKPKFVVPKPTLKEGDKSKAVGQLQAILNHLNFKCGTVDEDYGDLTKDAVLRFQKFHGIKPYDGIAGKKTLAKIAEELK